MKKLAIKIYYDDLTGDIECPEYSKRLDHEGRLFKMDILRNSILALEILFDYEFKQLVKETDIEVDEVGVT